MHKEDLICRCSSNYGYVFKNMISFLIASRGRPTISISHNQIFAENQSVNGDVFARTKINGDEIDLKWKGTIPVDKRMLHLSFDAKEAKAVISAIKKKGMAGIHIYQLQNEHNIGNFDEPGSSDTFYMTFWVTGKNSITHREGDKSLLCTRVEYNSIMTISPDPFLSQRLVVPASSFRETVKAFMSCKKTNIALKFHTKDILDGSGQILETLTGIILRSDGYPPLCEKLGDVEETNQNSYFNWVPDMNKVIKQENCGVELVLEEEVVEPNEFHFNSENLGIFDTLCALHLEGTIRFFYEVGKQLKISTRFGPFGTCEIYLSNGIRD